MFHLFTLVSFIALYTSAFSFGALAFQFIERLFPDPLSYGYGGAFGAGRTAIAGLIVAFPLYLFLMRLVWKETRGNARNLDSGVRKWFTYITLVVVAGIMLGDLIAVVSNVLGGELAVRFFLKAFTIFAIAGSIFGYHLYDLKRKQEDALPSGAKAFAGVVILLVVAFIAYGIFITGTPGQQRAAQFDQRRISDLQQISYAIDAYWERENQLPASFDDLGKGKVPYAYVQSVKDPRTQEPYEYRLLGEKTYELCADFETDSKQVQARAKIPVPFSEETWEHGIGRACFEREVRGLRELLRKDAVPSLP
ncbi:MAG: hypothetical protein HYS52_02090 [Candidatus Wildermuthbacteria bacterium]|nr:hypothetical protein [Candidatus Wildermuthbacteria bacterium]